MSGNNRHLEYHQLIVSNAFPYIGEKIFGYLDYECLLNCTLVCQSWKHFIERHESWWYKAINEAKINFQNQNMNLQSLADWIKLLDQVGTYEKVKEILFMIKESNEHSRSNFWNSGPKSHQGALDFLQKRLFRKERQYFLKFRRPVDVPVLTMNRDHLDLIWQLSIDKNYFYNACFQAIQQYCKGLHTSSIISTD